MARNDDAPQPGSLVAAASTTKLTAAGSVSAAAVGERQKWQPEAWQAWRTVPEIKQPMLFLGNAMAKLRLYVAVTNPTDPEGDPIPATSQAAIDAGVDQTLADAAEAQLDRLKNSNGGVSELLRKLNLQLEIPGEGWLVGLAARAAGDPDPRPGPKFGQPLEAPLPEDWSVRSTSEVLSKTGRRTATGGKPGRYAIAAGPNDRTGRVLDEDAGDMLVRVWVPDPEWNDLADSAMQAVLGEVRMLHTLTAQQMAVANSQMHAGVLLVPTELGLQPAQPTDGSAPENSPFLVELDRSYAEPIGDPDHMGTVRPMVMFGPAQWLKEVRHLRTGRELDVTLDSRIELRVRRIARGLNVPVEVVEGHMATTFSNAEQIDQDTFDDHLEPRCRTTVDSLTAGFLHPNLLAPPPAMAGAEPTPAFTPEQVAEVFVWYDPKALIRQPDVEANADQAHTAFAISDAAYRRALGFSDDDAPTALEIITRVGTRRGIFTAEVSVALLRELANEAGVELPEPGDLIPGGAPTAEAGVVVQALWLQHQLDQRRTLPGPVALPAARAPQASTAGTDLLAIDQALRLRLEQATSDAVGRAMERASNRLRSKVPTAQRAGLAGVGWQQLPAQLGRATIDTLLADTNLDSLLAADAFDELEQQFMAWGAQAQDDATGLVYQVVGGFSADERAALKLRQADDLAQAWEWLEDTLRALALGRLLDGEPGAPAVGEFDPTLRVPTGLLRQALARAGGAANLTATDLGGVFVTLTDGGQRPAGGIATGDRLRDVLRDHGAMVEAYQWVYGPAMRRTNFQPHLSLDGQVFRNFDDPVLANGSGWPPLSHYLPGDHAGCRCDVAPVIVPPSALPPEPEPAG